MNTLYYIHFFFINNKTSVYRYGTVVTLCFELTTHTNRPIFGLNKLFWLIYIIIVPPPCCLVNYIKYLFSFK